MVLKYLMSHIFQKEGEEKIVPGYFEILLSTYLYRRLDQSFHGNRTPLQYKKGPCSRQHLYLTTILNEFT